MFVSSDRTGPLSGRGPLTWANTLPLVAAKALCRRLRSLLTNTEPDSGPLGAVQTGEHSRLLLANEINFAAAACLVATVASLLRGRRHVHEEHGVPAAGRAAASVGHNLEGGQGGVGRVRDPAAVGRHLAQRP
jgi:hypothetical protein